MARKDLLKGLMAPPAPADGAEETTQRVDAARPRYKTGAIGAVSQSIAELKSRSVTEVDPRMIDAAGLRDRIDADDPDHAALVQSIRDYGQQVPVLLRPNPNYPERYEVVYGRRRVAALRELGQPVKAMVRVLDDRALIIAQGQENAARKDLTFIEKANFARQMRDAGYERKVICDALHMDKSLISRMLSVADRIPLALIEAIGSAPGIGRDRWLKLADRLGSRDMTGAARGDSSDQRFEAVMTALGTADKKPKAQPRNTSRTIADAGGTPLATAQRSGGRLALKIDPKTPQAFDDWLVEHLPEIYRDWQNRRGE
jgi:ParB family chromosome partitioning protein